MGGAKKTQAATTTVLGGIKIQSSVAGAVIPRGWGTYRVAGNLIYYTDFTAVAVPNDTSSSGGKGGGSTPSTSTTYNYSASVIMAIAQGPIVSVRTVYKDKNVYADNVGPGTALQQAGLSLATGELGQAPWDYVVANHPDEALGYSEVAYVYAANYALGSGASLGNHSFEVVSELRYESSDDANPADILEDFIPSIPFWPTGAIADLGDYRDYCRAVGLLLSPVLDTQRTAQDFITEIMQATNSNIFWSGGQLKVVPYGDTEIDGWVPDLTPIYDLTDDDFIPQSQGSDPVLADLTRGVDAYNYVQVEFLDRTQNYNTQVVPGTDQANIIQYGRLQNTSPYSLHSICDPVVAGTIAQLIVQRTCNIRTTYKFSLPLTYCLLEPMDLVTLTTGTMLDQVLVRITSAAEQNGQIDFEAEEMLVGTAHTGAYSPGGGGGYVPDYNVAPGPTNESALINPNRTLTNGDYELWLAACGTSAAWGGAEIWGSWDGDSYSKLGQIVARGRFGQVLHDFPVGPDPDTTDTLSVDLTGVAGVLLPGSQADADNAITLCLVNEELISYENADLTSSFQYDLSYIRRGLYASTIAEAVIGDPFVRLDDAITRIPYDPGQAGQTLHIKFRSFNIFGLGLQDLSDATDHVVILDPGAPPILDIISTDTMNVGGRPSSLVLTELDSAITAIEALDTEAEALRADVDTQATALLQQVVNSINLKKYFDAITWVGQTDVKTAVVNEIINRIDGDTAIVETISIIGVKSLDGLSFIINDATVQISPGLTVGSYISTIASQISTNSAAITSEATTRATADSATATLIGLVGAQNIGGTAFVFNSSTAQVSPGVSLGSYISGVSSSISGVSASVTSEASTRASADSTIASNLSTVSTTVSGHTASISSLSSSVSGIMASWGVSIDVNGNVAGIQLVGTGTTSYLAIVAASLFFADSAGSLQSPFYITGGVVYADNLVVRLLRAGTIITDHIQDNQVSVPVYTSTSGGYSGSGTITIMSFNIAATSAGTVYASTTISQGFSAIPSSWALYLVINGTTVDSASGTVPGDSVALSGGIAVSAGTIPVHVLWAAAGTITLGTSSLYAQALMK